MAIYGQRFINGSFKSLGVPAPFCDTGMAWTDNLLVPEACCRDRVSVGDWAWGTQSGLLIGSDVPWFGLIPAHPSYLPISPLEMRSQLRAASVMLAFNRTIWRGLKVSCMPTTSAVTRRLIFPIMTGIIFGMNWLMNNFDEILCW